MKCQRFVAAFDNHGAEQDNAAVNALFEFCKEFKPQIRIHGGDCFDFARLRRAAKDDERRAPLKDDLEVGITFLQRYKPNFYLRGNHCERMWDAQKSDDGALSDFASYAITDITEVLGDAQMFPYCKRRGVLKLGKLSVIHGFNGGEGAVKASGLVYGPLIMGHIHAHDVYSVPGLEMGLAQSCGCLCKLDQDYNRAQAKTLRQMHGWAYGLLFDSGDYIVWQAKKIGGKFYYASEVGST